MSAVVMSTGEERAREEAEFLDYVAWLEKDRERLRQEADQVARLRTRVAELEMQLSYCLYGGLTYV